MGSNRPRQLTARSVAPLAALGAVLALSPALAAEAKDKTSRAQELQKIEQELRLSEERAAGLRGSLEARGVVLAELLAAMQRVGANPPPALLVRPEDALGSVRAALLLGAALPELRAQAEALAADLKQLASVKERIEAEQETLRRDLAGLAE